MLLKVELPVMSPWPTIGSPLELHVTPSSVDFFTRTIALFLESWYETQTFEPFDVIHWRSAFVVSRNTVLQFAKTAPGHDVAETPSWKLLKTGLTMKSSPASWIVPVEPKSMSASPLPSAMRL